MVPGPVLLVAPAAMRIVLKRARSVKVMRVMMTMMMLLAMLVMIMVIRVMGRLTTTARGG